MPALAPNDHTIVSFRKALAFPLQFLFKLYVQFLGDAGLLDKTTIGTDGSKFKAVNSRKNTDNQKEIDKHRGIIEEKTARYLQDLDALDKEENTCAGDERQVKKKRKQKAWPN